MQRRRAFLVGRSGRRSTTVVVLQIAKGPIIGPWTVRAVVSTN